MRVSLIVIFSPMILFSSKNGLTYSNYVLSSSLEVVDTVSNQVTRQTTGIVSGHLSSLITASFIKFDAETGGASVSNGNKLAASSDSNKYLPDDLWGISSITQISDDNGPHSDTDIYQFVGGFDKVMGDFIIGSALTYAHTEDEQGNIHSTAETVGVTPYLAYKITDYLFASTLLGYNYTHVNSTKGGSDVDINDFISETNLSGFKVINSFILKGRAGIRYKHTHTMLEKDFNGRDDDYDELTWLGDIEVGYKFANKLRVYTGFLYEYNDRESSAASSSVHDGIGYMRYSAEYPVMQELTLSAKLEHDVSDEDQDLITGSINARLEF